MVEAMAISKSTRYRKEKEEEALKNYNRRYNDFVNKNKKFENQSHSSWSGLWKIYTYKRTECDKYFEILIHNNNRIQQH